MTTNLKIIIGVVILLIVMFFTGKCSNSPEIITKTITLPAVKGKSDTIYKLIPVTKYKLDSIIYKDSILYHDKEFDKEIVEKFTKLNSEYEKVKSYIKATEINSYTIPIEDSIIKTISNIKVRGELVSFQRDYFIKEQKVPIKIKVPKTVFKMNIGGGLMTTTDLSKFTPTANIILTNYNENHLIFQGGLDGSIQVGVSINIINFKR